MNIQYGMAQQNQWRGVRHVGELALADSVASSCSPSSSQHGGIRTRRIHGHISVVAQGLCSSRSACDRQRRLGTPRRGSSGLFPSKLSPSALRSALVITTRAIMSGECRGDCSATFRTWPQVRDDCLSSLTCGQVNTSHQPSSSPTSETAPPSCPPAMRSSPVASIAIRETSSLSSSSRQDGGIDRLWPCSSSASRGLAQRHEGGSAEASSNPRSK